MNFQNTSVHEFNNTKVIGNTPIRLEINDVPATQHAKLIRHTQWLHPDQTFNNGLKLAFMNTTALIGVHQDLGRHLHFMIELITN